MLSNKIKFGDKDKPHKNDVLKGGGGGAPPGPP